MLRKILKKTFFTLHTISLTASLQASDFTWTGTTSARLNLGSNWSPSEPPQPTPTIGDVAEFSNAATQFSPFLSDGSTFALYLASFDEATTDYSFQISNNSTLTFGVSGDTSEFSSGVENMSATSVTQTFTINDGASLNFLGLSNASINQNQDNIIYYIGTSIGHGILDFNDNSSAGTAIINAGDITGSTNIPGMITFHNSSTAGSSNILIGDHLGMSAINFYSDSNTVFSTAGTASIQIGSTLPTTKNVYAILTFNGFSSAGNATIQLGDQQTLSELIFLDSSTADHAVITLGNVANNMSGKATFQNASSAAFSQINVTNGSILEFDTGSSGGECSVNLTSSGLLNLPDPGSYSIGSLTGDSSSLVHLSSANLTINYNGNNTIEMAGQISDASMGGSLTKTGIGTLNLSGTNTYTGITTIQEGTLAINGALKGDILLTNGKLSGTGSISGNVTANGGIVSPGNSIGTLPIAGNYVQNTPAIYLVQLNQRSGSLLNIQGTATLNNAPVAVLVEGPLFFNSPYLILQADGGITGAFTQPIFDFSGNDVNASLLQGNINYSNDRLVFLSIETNLQNGATTSNQKNVAEQLDSIQNPSPCENRLLNALVREDSAYIGYALDQLSGEPYSNLFYIAEINTLHCIQNLYTQLRPLITTNGNCCCNTDTSIWLETGGGRSFLQKDGNAAGLHMNSYQLCIGTQSYLNDSWILGGAFFYEHDAIHFNVNANGSNKNILGAIYTLFRPSCGYILADLIGGYSNNSVKRRIDIGEFRTTARGCPKFGQFTFYAEGGIDFRIDRFLFQPFLGLETSYYHRRSINEHGDICTNLIILQKDYENVCSRLGIHCTYIPDFFQTIIGIDASWQYRFTAAQNHSKARFDDFGNLFYVKGISWDQNSVEGSIFLNTELTDCWEFSAKLSGQLWGNATTYDFLIGLENFW